MGVVLVAVESFMVGVLRFQLHMGIKIILFDQ